MQTKTQNLAGIGGFSPTLLLSRKLKTASPRSHGLFLLFSPVHQLGSSFSNSHWSSLGNHSPSLTAIRDSQQETVPWQHTHTHTNMHSSQVYLMQTYVHSYTEAHVQTTSHTHTHAHTAMQTHPQSTHYNYIITNTQRTEAEFSWFSCCIGRNRTK